MVASLCSRNKLLGVGEFYLKLRLFPGLLSNFLLSKGNLSPPISNIFSASWKEGRHQIKEDSATSTTST